MGHYIENIGSTTMRCLNFSKPMYKDVSLNNWMALTPPDMVRGHLNLDDTVMNALRRERRPVVWQSGFAHQHRQPDANAWHNQEVKNVGEIVIGTTVALQHERIVLACSFERARDAPESILPTLNTEAIALLHDGEAERARVMLEHGPELSVFGSRDHGGVLRMAGMMRKALQYDVGNPLTASKITSHQLPASLYAPFRVVLYEDPEGRRIRQAVVTLFGQFGDDQVTEVARVLDAAIQRAIRQSGDA